LVLGYLVGCLTTAGVATVFGDPWLVALFLTGVLTAFQAWRHMRWPDTWARYLSFGAVLLLACIVNRVFYLADYFVTGPRFAEWPFFARSPEVALFKGELMTVLGTLTTVFAWRFAGGMRISPSILFEKSSSDRIYGVIYVMSVLGLTASRWSPTVSAQLGQLLPVLHGLGVVSSALLPMARFKHGLARLVTVAVLSVPFVIAASGTGMKENMILAILPAALLAWRYFRHPVLRTGMVAGGLLALALLTSYVNFFRAEVWSGKTSDAREHVTEDFVREVEAGGVGSTAMDGLKAFVARNNASVHRGWAVSIADEQQFYPSLVFSPMTYVFVPRILWPDKPLIQQGWEYSGVVFGQDYIAWSDSSTAAGFYPSLYLGYGWLPFGVGAIFVGWLLAGLTRLAQRLAGPNAAALYIFGMLPFILRLDETWSVGVLTGPIISLFYILVVFAIAKLLASATRLGDRLGAATR
jgi:hypothetical protein